MKSLFDFALKEMYKKVKKLRPRMERMNSLIDWGKFLPLFPEKETKRGRPNYEKILMIKILFLQSWYGISDEEVEFQIHDRISFQQFLDFPTTIPDYSTIWRFREELQEENILDNIWKELQKQIDEKHIKIDKGVIQDATFVEADPGKKNSGMAGRGREAKTSRSKDGSWTKKGKKSIFGFKAHTKIRRDSKIVEELALTTAKTHDGRIDLAKPDEIVYRDKGYSGCGTKASGDASMKKGKLSVKDKLRNKRIQKKRAIGEHPYGTIQRSFKGGRTKLTTLGRVFVQQAFVFMAYNIYRADFLVRNSIGV